MSAPWGAAHLAGGYPRLPLAWDSWEIPVFRVGYAGGALRGATVRCNWDSSRPSRGRDRACRKREEVIRPLSIYAGEDTNADDDPMGMQGMTGTAPFTVAMDGPAWLSMEMKLEGVTPSEALAWFTQADKLRQWWGPQEIKIDPVPGGAYVVSWPKMGWTMRGQITTVSDALLDALLVYSWSWDHEPHMPARAVIVHAVAQGNGARLTITHGPFRQGDTFPREDEDRTSHREGWANFLPELKRVAEGQG